MEIATNSVFNSLPFYGVSVPELSSEQSSETFEVIDCDENDQTYDDSVYDDTTGTYDKPSFYGEGDIGIDDSDMEIKTKAIKLEKSGFITFFKNDKKRKSESNESRSRKNKCSDIISSDKNK